MIKKRGNKYAVYDKKGKKKLGGAQNQKAGAATACGH